MSDTPEKNKNEGASMRTLMGYGIWAVSIAVGLVLTWFMVFVVFATDLERFGVSYFFISAFSIAILLVIWLDYFLDTRILPD